MHPFKQNMVKCLPQGVDNRLRGPLQSRKPIFDKIIDFCFFGFNLTLRYGRGHTIPNDFLASEHWNPSQMGVQKGNFIILFLHYSKIMQFFHYNFWPKYKFWILMVSSEIFSSDLSEYTLFQILKIYFFFIKINF